MLPLGTNRRCRLRAEITDAEHGARVAHAIRFEQCKLLHRPERPVRRRNQSLDQNFWREVLNFQVTLYIIRECRTKILYTIARKCQARRHLVTAKLDDRVPARSKCLIQMEPRDAAARALVDIALPCEDNARTVVFLDKTGCDNADDAGVPILPRDDDRGHIGRKVCKHFLRFGEDILLEITALCVERIQLTRDAVCLPHILGDEEFHAAPRGLDAPRRIEARGKLEADHARIDCLSLKTRNTDQCFDALTGMC